MKPQEERSMRRLDTQGQSPSMTSSFSSRGLMTPLPSSPSYYERRPSLASTWSDESALSGYSFGSSQRSSGPSTPKQEEEEILIAGFGNAEGYHFEDLALMSTLAQPQLGNVALPGEYPMTPPHYKPPVELPDFAYQWDPLRMALDGATAPACTIDPALTSVFDSPYPDTSSTDTPLNSSFASIESVLSPLTPPAFCIPSETYTGQSNSGEDLSRAEEDCDLASPSLIEEFYSSDNLDDFLRCNASIDTKPSNYITSREEPSRTTRIRRPSRQSNNIRLKHGREKCRRVDLKKIPADQLFIIPDSEGAKPHKCSQIKDGVPCTARFKRREHLKRHQKSKGHSEETPFHCHGCDKKFGRSDNFAQHKRTHMIGKGRNPYIENFVVDP
ncbi:MAG: hypothetical protein M1812_002149 [Candelaria pacifica]|nr:MAG: hypothetical protein M1812_002149 [Candelaria pacifica]